MIFVLPVAPVAVPCLVSTARVNKAVLLLNADLGLLGALFAPTAGSSACSRCTSGQYLILK